MYSRRIATKFEHDGLVRTLAEHFKYLGYRQVAADLDDYAKPSLIKGTLRDHIPDVTCVKSVYPPITIIAEAETGDSLRDEHTISQLQLFRSAATNTGGEFHLMVPAVIDGQPGHSVASNWLRQLGLAADQIWVPKNK